jgi:hypothetical protein
MSALRQAVHEYLALRRRLGVTLHEAGRVLGAFATYVDQEGAAQVTTDLVLRWAARFPSVSSATLHDRVQMIRRFAQWRQLTDPGTDVPRADLVPGRYRRRPPRLYRDDVTRTFRGCSRARATWRRRQGCEDGPTRPCLDSWSSRDCEAQKSSP